MAQGDNHTNIVAEVKGELVARGVNLHGDCGAFEITKRVAWRLRKTSIGLLSKSAGADCYGFAAGFLVYPDLTGVDMLGDAGGKNTPQWSVHPPDGELFGRWRAPFDPGDSMTEPPPAPPEPPPPAPPQPDEDWIRVLLESLDRIGDGVEGLALAVNAQTKAIESYEVNGVRLRFR